MINLKSVSRTLAAALAAVFLSSAVRAETGFESFFNGNGEGVPAFLQEQLAKASDVPVPAARFRKDRSTDTSSGGNNEFLHFWDDLKSDVFDDLCKEVRIELNEGASMDNVGGIEGRFKRYLKQYPDNRIALIDEVGLRLDGNHVFGDTFQAGEQYFNVGLTGRLEGKSVVVRKYGETKYCKELLKVVDIRKVKTVLPLNERRIREMGVSEIWKFPVVLRMGISGGAGYPVAPWATVSFSLGSARETKPSVTLYRMDENNLRMRIRLDRVEIKSAAASAGTSFDAGMIGLPEAENFLVKEMNRALVKEFNKYLAFKFGISHERAKGRKILLEFVLNPNNNEQMARLVDFLKGDLSVLRKLMAMGVHFSDFTELDDVAAGQQALASVEEVGSQALGLNATFAGSNMFHSTSNGFNVVLPIILNHEARTTRRYDRYQAIDSDQVLHMHSVTRNESESNINVPFVGKIFKHNTNQNFYVVNYENKDGSVTDPVLIYQRYEGMVKHQETDARGMVEAMNEILKYAGTAGEGVNNSFKVDTSALFPYLAAQEADPQNIDEFGQPSGIDSRRYKSAVMSFALVFTKEAVADIVAAPPSLILKAMFNVMDGVARQMVEKIRHLFYIKSDGEVDYDWKKALPLLREFETDDFRPLDEINRVCYSATRLIKDLTGIKSAGGWRQQSERLSEVMAGKGKSGVGYENMLQVVVQLVKVKDLFANISVQTDKRIKGEENVSYNGTFYNQNIQASYNSQLGNVNSIRDRFSDPTELTD